MNSTKRSSMAVALGLTVLVVMAGCADMVGGQARAATTAVSTTSSSSSESETSSSSTSSSVPDTSGGKRTNSTRSSTSETSTSESSTSESSTESSTSTSAPDDPNVAPASVDLLWSYPTFSADWTATTDEPGIHEYQYKQTQCSLGLYQPGGYQKRPILPTDAEIVSEYLADVGKKYSDPARVSVDTTGRDFSTDVNGVPDGEVPATITMAGEHATFAAEGGEAQLYGYRNADYALVVAVYCKGGEFATYLPEIAPKFDELRISLYY